MKHKPAKRRPNKPPKFTISVLAMNGLEMTRKCLESAMANNEPYELILTDNASDDGTAEYFDELAREFSSRVRVIHNLKNGGYADPHNHALNLAKGKYFICLNNDTEVPPEWLAELERPFLSQPDAAISGPQGSCCSLQDPWPSFHGSRGNSFEYVEGSCLCIPTELAREHTLFAPYLRFAYGEDVDLSLRMRAMGKTIHAAYFSITHKRAATASQLDPAFIEEVKKYNHKVLRARWGTYHKFRRFDLPFVVRRKDAIGDVLLTTPLIAEIKRQCPRSEIYVETNHPGIFKDNPNVAEAKNAPIDRIYKWATIIDLDMSYENLPETNIVEAYFKTANFTYGGNPRRIEIYPAELDHQMAEELLPGGNYVAIHPGPLTWKGKNWPWERWQTLIQELLTRGRYPVIVGAAGPALPNWLDVRGKTDFQQLAAILARCQAFVGLDSFPLHVAQAVGIPVVGLFGASDPRYILTDGICVPVCGTTECFGARHRVAGQTFVDCDGACMASITVEQVLAAVDKIL
jgi:ADP-heptose:LPS heptosyltransferase/GT2 family glycosyltransferase